MKKIHGHAVSRSPTYLTWVGMKQRCDNPNHIRFNEYGGRGISYCDRWEDFTLFLTDMGVRPEGMTLDRVRNSKGYSKENCRWATLDTQFNNRRSSRLLTFKGETLSMAQWSSKLGVHENLIGSRIRNGWGIERALTTKVRSLNGS